MCAGMFTIPAEWDVGENNSELLFVGSNSVFSLREQLAHLHQAIQSSANTILLQQYEEVIRSLLSHIHDNRRHCERLETSLKR